MNKLSRENRLSSAAQTLQIADSGFDRAAFGRLRSEPAAEKPTGWNMGTFAGRFSEITGASASASLTLVFRLLLEVQQQGEPAAWITSRKSTFYPPDAAIAGIDIMAVAVIRCPDIIAAARSAEHLLRSGSFGIIIIDLGANVNLMQHAQSRLAGQARKHNTALICLTEKEVSEPSLGSLVSLRVHTERLGQNSHISVCRANALKDKRHGPGWSHVENCHGPDGLY
jgi:recombination protein RecA